MREKKAAHRIVTGLLAAAAALSVLLTAGYIGFLIWYQTPQQMQQACTLYDLNGGELPPVDVQIDVTRTCRLFKSDLITGTMYVNGKAIPCEDTSSREKPLDRLRENLQLRLGKKVQEFSFANEVFKDGSYKEIDLCWMEWAPNGTLLLTIFPDEGGLGGSYCGPADRWREANRLYKENFRLNVYQ